MLSKRATLIQTVPEYMFLLNEAINLLEPLLISSIDNRDSLIKWLVAEELELIYGIFVNGHIHNKEVYNKIHNKLIIDKGTIYNQRTLSSITARCILVPELKNYDNKIDLDIQGNDIFISYYIDHNHFNLKRI